MNNTITISSTTLQDCLVQNNRFANKSLNADQLGADTLKSWTSLITRLHSVAYSVYAICENNNLTLESSSVNKSALFNTLREVLSVVGEVKGHKLCANDDLANLIMSYSGKRGNDDSPELQLCMSKIRNRNNELKDYEKTNGVKPETIQAMKDEIEELEEEKKALLNSPDNRIKKPTRTSASAFRLDVEHRLARVITEQQAKSWEELEAEAEARRKARRAKTAAKKQAKNANTETLPTMDKIPADAIK